MLFIFSISPTLISHLFVFTLKNNAGLLKPVLNLMKSFWSIFCQRLRAIMGGMPTGWEGVRENIMTNKFSIETMS